MDMTDAIEPRARLRMLARYWLYPFSWAVALLAFHMIWTSGIDPRRIWAMTAGFLAALYLLAEWLVPYEKRWAMNWRSFLADFRFALINTLFVAGLSSGLALLTIGISGDLDGPARHWPPAAQLVSCLLIFEAVNYSLHRAMHEADGKLGKLLWSVHAAHHLPPRLYLVMHAVFHPLNGIIIQGLAIILPIWLMGYDQKIVTMFLIINGMHGLISHFNVDVRMGWMNYVFVGPELHRYHHSARVDEAKNYGATLSVFDRLFGTFVYRPGTPPSDLGVDSSSGLPPYERTWAVLMLPFSRA